MSNTTCNGWSNYATWRVNLEIFDGLDGEFFSHCDDISDMATAMKDFAEELLEQSAETDSLVLSYALAFLDDVDWYEIALAYVDINQIFMEDME